MSSPAEYRLWIRSLTAEAGLFDPLEVHTPDGLHPVHLVNLHLTPVHRPADQEAQRSECKHLDASITAHARDASGQYITADLSLALSEDVFQRLWDAVDESAELWLVLELAVEDGGQAKLELCTQREDRGVRLAVSSIEQRNQGSTPVEWFEARRGKQLAEACRPLYFNEPGGNQVALVCHELAADLARLEDGEARARKLPQVFELMRTARTAFRAPLAGTGHPCLDNAYALDKAGFEQYIAPFDDNRQADLRRAYDTLWEHFRLADSMTDGEDKAGPARSGMRCAPDALDQVASLYAALGARSPSMEWMLVDALVLGECLGFAQYVNSEENFLGIVMPRPLKPEVGFKWYAQGLAKAAGQVLLEGVKLALTFAVAWTLTESNVVATWVVVTGFTGWRWMRRLHLRRELDPKLRLAELLDKMGWASESLKKPEFNAGDVRQQIYALSQQGASFSPWVLNLLDRRIEQAAMERATVAGHTPRLTNFP